MLSLNLLYTTRILNVTTLIQPDVNSSLCKTFCYLIPKNSTSRMSILLHHIGESLLRHNVLLFSSLTPFVVPQVTSMDILPILEITVAFNPLMDCELLRSKRTHLSFLNYFCTNLLRNQISLKSVGPPLHLLNQIKEYISKL